MTKKKKKHKYSSPLSALLHGIYHWLVAVAAVIVVLFVAYQVFLPPPVVAVPLVAQPVAATDNPATAENEAEHVAAPLVRKPDYYTFLLAASDQASGNADTIIAVSYDVGNQKVSMVSIPRDTLVDMKSPKINNTYAVGGMPALKKAVDKLLGFQTDFWMTVDIAAFRAIINALDGIDFDIPIRMDYDDPIQDLHIHYESGMRHLTGQQALEVVRFRKNNDGGGYPDSDIGRTHTQQALLAAVAKKALSLKTLTKLNSFVEIFGEHVKTDLSPQNMAYFASQALAFDLKTGLTSQTLPGDGSVTYRGTTWCYELDQDAALEIFNTLLNPYTTPLTHNMAQIFAAP